MERFKSKVGQNVVLYHSLRVLDSFQFMSQSLDSLEKTVDKLLRTGFLNNGDNYFGKLIKKGFFPYNYLDSFEKFIEPFPPHGPLWYNTLAKSIEVTKKQHNFASGVYNAFECKHLGDYPDIYLRTDVFLLADISQKFGEVCMHVYKFHPAHYYSVPNLSCDAMLITTGVKLEILQDIDQLLFFEKGNRGGINRLGALRRVISKQMINTSKTSIQTRSLPLGLSLT